MNNINIEYAFLVRYLEAAVKLVNKRNNSVLRSKNREEAVSRVPALQEAMELGKALKAEFDEFEKLRSSINLN